ncbi:MAG: hypothetical protein ACRCT6_10870 [Notoacmeibacter sp.]
MRIDPAHPFYAAAWRRYAIVASCFIWAGIELYLGSPLWAMLFGAAGGYTFWVLIFKFGNASKDS